MITFTTFLRHNQDQRATCSMHGETGYSIHYHIYVCMIQVKVCLDSCTDNRHSMQNKQFDNKHMLVEQKLFKYNSVTMLYPIRPLSYAVVMIRKEIT